MRLTVDGHIVIFHDSDTLRLTGHSMIVEQSTLAELQALPFADQPIPTLASLLALVDGRTPILAEVKCEGRRTDWYRALDDLLSGYRGRIGVMSFDPLLMHWVRAKAPAIRRGLVVADRLGWFRRWLAMRHARPDFLAVETAAAARPWARRARRKIPLYCWTVRTAEQRERCRPFADALIWEADGRP